MRDDAAALARLFAPDSEYRLGARIVATGPAAIAEALRPSLFSEQTQPRLELRDLFPLTPELSLIRAQQIAYGTLILKQRVAVLLLVRRTGSGWKSCVVDGRPVT